MDKGEFSWKKFTIAIVILFLVIGMMAVFGAYFLLGRGGDIAPPDDSQLILTPAKIEGENSYIHLEKLGKIWQQVKNFDDKLHKIKLLKNPKPEELAQVIEIFQTEKVWEKNQKAYQILKKAIECEEGAYPYEVNYKAPILNILSYKSLSQAIYLQAKIALQNKQLEKAMVLGMELYQICYRIEQSSAVLISNATAHICRDFALQIFQEAIPLLNSSNDLENGKKYLHLLQKYQSTDEFLIESIRGEYTNITSTLNMAAKQETPKGFHVSWEEKMEIMFLFQPNRTKKIIMDIYETMLTSVPMTEQDRTDFLEKQPDLIMEESQKTRNQYGSKILALAMPSIASMIKRHQNQIAQSSLVCVVLAIKLFQIENGRLPNSMDDLVKKYLKHTPKNPLNDAAFSYDAKEKKVIYGETENSQYKIGF